MKARVLPLLPNLEPESESIYTWDIENYRSLTRKERSPKFECGGYPWYVGRQCLKGAMRRVIPLTPSQEDTALPFWQQCRLCLPIPRAGA